MKVIALLGTALISITYKLHFLISSINMFIILRFIKYEY